jgi:transmembrane sensor
MTEWLQRARAESAGLSMLAATEHVASLRQGIDRRLRRRRSARNATYVAATAGLLLVSWASFVRPEVPGELARGATPAGATREPAARPSWRFEDGSLATALDSVAALRVERDDRERTLLQLDAGSARFAVRPRAGRAFVVRAGAVEVRVLGTRFDVARRNDGWVDVAVAHGVVQVEATGESRLLRAGERASFRAQASAPVAVAPATAPAIPAPAAAKPASVTEAPRSEPTGAGRPRRSAANEHVARAADAAGELLAAADLARRQGRPDAAASALERVLRLHAHDPRAASAAFTLGRVRLEQQGQPARAATAFARAGQLDPRGPLAEDALAREVEAWARAGERERARALGERYLQRYPGSARTAFVRTHAGLSVVE